MHRNWSLIVAFGTTLRTLRKSASGSSTTSNTRCAETLPLKRVCGGMRGSSVARSPVSSERTLPMKPRSPWPLNFVIASAPSEAIRRAVPSEKRAKLGRRSTLCTSAREYSSTSVGSRSE